MFKNLTLIVFSFLFYWVHAQQDINFCDRLNALDQRIQQFHYQPKPLNDSLSKGVFNLFLNRLDENKRFFHQADIHKFKIDQYQLDDAISQNNCSFIDKYSTVLQHRIEATKSYISSLYEEPLDYTGKDTIRFISDQEFKYYKNDQEFKNYWNKRIRFLILDHLIEQDSTLSYLEANFNALETAIKPKIIQNQICLLDEFLHKNGNIDNFVKEAFLNALANYHDPNSFYFNSSEKSQFESTVANKQFTFGIQTEKDLNGNIVITYITPGSSASLNGHFEENDVIKSLTSTSKTLEAFCISNDDIEAFISNQDHETIVFKIKKQNGAILDIELAKTEVKIEENSSTAFVLNTKSDYAYLKIPSFYTDFDLSNGYGLTYDVVQQLLLPEIRNARGLIIDLRFNGGGSMKEAANLSGLFINTGPLAILKHGNGDTFTVENGFKGTIFNKPLVILIDQYSSSAAEFFAAAMQDYNRAVIVGSPSHGKASTQIIIPVSDINDLGFCKLTIEKFYRITGRSHQSLGVIPDIILPSLLDGLKTNEAYSPFALSNDTVRPQLNYRPYKQLPLSSIRSKSKIRIDNNTSFNTIKEMNAILLANYVNRNTAYPLTLHHVYDDVEEYNTLWSNLYEVLDSNKKTISVKNTMSTAEKLIHGNAIKFNQNQKEDIANDMYILEALAILTDIGRKRYR